MESMRFNFCLIIAAVFFFSCGFDSVECPVVEKESAVETPSAEEKKENSWTFVVYMAADNGLEEYSTLDIKEMERSLAADSGITILVLWDRAEGYDKTNSGWTDTRLFEIKSDTSSYGTDIVSSRISCPDIGLSADSETELNMASVSVLSGVLSFARREYPAEHSGVILWGHGNGSAFISDDYSGRVMSVPDVQEALKAGSGGRIIDFLGFDTCFSAELEVLYELKDCAAYFAGSPGLVKDYGWDYASFFGSIAEAYKNGKSDTALCAALCAESQFVSLYGNAAKSAFSVVKLSAVQDLFSAFDELSSGAAAAVTNSTARDTLFSLLYSNTVSYSASSVSCYKFLSVKDFAQKLSSFDASLSEKSSAVTDALQKMSAGVSSVEQSPAVFFCNISQSGTASALIPSEYCKNSTPDDSMSFIQDSLGYSPGTKKNNSLLDKLFYSAFF